MKVFVTLFLLFAIALSIIYFFSFGEDRSESAAAFVIPIVIEVLLLFIFFFSDKNTLYRKVFKVILMLWSVIFIFAIAMLIYFTGLSGAFSH